ncbi:DUF402 domain-containing protein [Nocardia huaxiensis]|uniref:DUF402 domain-containing protein n=1 Tax=Nocardia huaxiensis TaxID=2755382 RepID=A0A7D6ZTX1_9NOCA|nr:DUF402 domain-containing protein [Nocardia huaxiensis]QLY33785.1 DUF402 domain-containing protein [Nocardia huaxiensis]UFS99290.1 DUF402 domain-containing protein [Nocardia huaxiensis]
MTGLHAPQRNSLNGVDPGRIKGNSHPSAPHKPRLEFFNLAELSWTDHHGYLHPVERLHAESWGLYMERKVDNPRFHYIESWLLPALSLRVTVYHLRPGHDRGQTYYLDIGEFGPVESKKWRAEAHYLHVVARPGQAPELLGIDELLAAHAAGHFDTVQTHRAIERAAAVVDGIAGCDHDVDRWLALQGVQLTWL